MTMTSDEHKLMLYLFTQQNIRFRALLELLRSHGVLEQGDFDAFEHLVVDTEMHDEIFAMTAFQYTDFATQLGLADQIPGGKKS